MSLILLYLDSKLKRNLFLVTNLLDLNDKTGVNKSGQTITERLIDI